MFNTPVVYDEQRGEVVVTVDHCWCLGCEHSAATLCEAGSAHTPESAQRETHSLRALERYIFEVYPGYARARSSPLRVPVLYLRHLFFDQQTLMDDELAWGVRHSTPETLEHGTPRWLQRVRALVHTLRATNYLLESVLAPFDETLVFVARHPRVVLDVLGGDDDDAARYGVDVPPAVLRHLDAHRIYAATLLRVLTAYRVLGACNGHAWDYDAYDTEVPYYDNEALQHTCLQLQLFIDTHLALLACVRAFGGARTDDVFFSATLSATAQTQSSAANFAEGGAVPIAARLSLLERYYPHPLRAPWAGEISSLGDAPLYAGNLWNVRTSQGGSAGSSAPTGRSSDKAGGDGGGDKDDGKGAASSAHSKERDAGGGKAGASSKRHNEDEFLEAAVHLFLSKTLNYRSLRRNYSNIATRNFHGCPALFAIQKASFEVSALGNFPGPRFRPLLRARVAIYQAHHFAPLSFEPAWCASCGTERLKSATKMVVQGNACKRCKPVQPALWCAAECMRGTFLSASDVEDAIAADGGSGKAAQNNANNGVSNRAVDEVQHEKARVRKIDVDAAFEMARADPELAGECDACAKLQERRVGGGQAPLQSRDLLEAHYTEMHLCPMCRRREHDDAQRVHERLVRKGKRTKLGSKTLCSRHLCDGCELVGRNELYSFYVAKEMYAFRVDREGCAVHVLGEHSNWRAYRRMLYSGMDEIRTLINAEYGDVPAAAAATDNVFTAARVDTAALTPRLAQRVREQMNHFHRSVKKTSTKFKKETFVSVLRKTLKTCFASTCVQRTMTRPQQPEDFLNEPDLVLEIGRVRLAELAHKPATTNARTLRARELLQHQTEEDTQRAHAKLHRWHAEYEFHSNDVHRVAERAAAQALGLQIDATRDTLAKGAASSTAAVNFRILRYVGFDEQSLDLVEEMAFNYEVLCMPDNPLGVYVRRLEQMNRADFCALLIFCNVYVQASAFRIYPLSIEAARAQMAALRRYNGLMPHEEAQADIDVRHVCRDCFKWYAPMAAPTRFSKFSTVIRSQDGNPMRTKRRAKRATSDARVDLPGRARSEADKHGAAAPPRRSVFSGAAAGPDSYADELREAGAAVVLPPLNADEMLFDLRLNELVCPLNKKSANLKTMLKYDHLNHDLVYESEPSKATSIRAKRQRYTQCGSRPLLKIAMLGVAVRIANEGQHGNIYALCGFCAQLFCMAEGKPMNDGVPSCGRHHRIGGLATQPYRALFAYDPPQIEPARRGAASGLRSALLAPHDVEPFTSPMFTREEISRSLRLIDSYEYGPPKRAFLDGLSANQAAARGWVRATPSIAQPKGIVEKSALAVLRHSFPLFDPEKSLMSVSTVPSSVPTLTSAELRRHIAYDWMRFDLAKSRVKREEDAIREEFNTTLAVLREHKIEGAIEIAEQMAHEANSGENVLTRRRARADNLSGGLPPDLIATRERCMSLLSGVYGFDTGATVVVCAFCGSSADIRSRYVRLKILDPDGLCRNRFTAAPVVASTSVGETQLRRNGSVVTAPRVEIFLCERHFGQAQPLLASFLHPTAAHLYTFLLYITREALEQTANGMYGVSRSQKKRSVKRDIALAEEYEDFYGTKEEAAKRRAELSRKGLHKRRKRAKRSRLSTLPERFAKLGTGKRRGRRPNSAKNDAEKALAQGLEQQQQQQQ